MKVPLEITYVTFEHGDLVGEILAFVTLTPIYVMVMYTVLVILRRDFHTLYALLGQCICLVVNKVLKSIISQPRPAESDLKDSGMPSNHSQFVGFFCIFYICQFCLNSKLLAIKFRVLYSVALLGLGSVVCFSRVYLIYHTPEQVFVGAVVGAVLGFLFAVVDIRFGKALGDKICSLGVVKFFGFRNYSPLENYLGIRCAPDKRTD